MKTNSVKTEEINKNGFYSYFAPSKNVQSLNLATLSFSPKEPKKNLSEIKLTASSSYFTKLTDDAGKKIISNTSAFTDPNLPLENGELPLHFAIRTNNQERVIELIEQGADVVKKDFQGLTAIDHAVLMNRVDLLPILMKDKIQCSLDQLESEMPKNPESLCRDLLSISRSLLNKDTRSFQKLSLLQKSIVLGQEEATLNLLSSETMADLKNIKDPQGRNLLHFAAMGPSKRIVEELIQRGFSPDTTDNLGRTALHYAAVQDNSALLTTLLQHPKTDVWAKDFKGASPLALMAAYAKIRDPLNITKSQAIIFLGILSDLGVTGIYSLGLISTETAVIMGFSSQILKACGSLTTIYHEMDKPWKTMLFWTGLLLAESTPVLSMPYHCFMSYHLLRGTVTGLQSVWNNASYRPWQGTKKGIVYSTNFVFGAMSTYQTLKKDVNDVYNWFTGQHQYTGNNGYKPPLQQPRIPRPSVEELRTMTDAERLMHEGLNPRNVGDALHMLSPDLTEEGFILSGFDKKYWSKPFRKLNLQYHSDKCKTDECAEIITRLSSLGDTLKNVGK
ncbi:MAG: hypothetical protein CMO81_03555 [Waddliaceae bacterium]|nr:hypothetical protein [Waddliaceae bacterium]